MFHIGVRDFTDLAVLANQGGSFSMGDGSGFHGDTPRPCATNCNGLALRYHDNLSLRSCEPTRCATILADS